jgi:DNA-binding transcriptional ArsR family regulator
MTRTFNECALVSYATKPSQSRGRLIAEPDSPSRTPFQRDRDRIATLFRMLADPTRLRILYALSGDELCVCDLGGALALSQSAASHQLATLRAAGLVKPRREGKIVYYSLDDDHVRTLLALGAEHSAELRP